MTNADLCCPTCLVKLFDTSPQTPLRERKRGDFIHLAFDLWIGTLRIKKTYQHL